MRLLILTQKVDAADSVLGFFHAWIVEFAKQFETVTVVCLEEGAYTLPKNIQVFSLGKETLEIRNWKLEISRRISYITRFYRLIWSMRRDYDVVFVHMNPEYVVLGGSLWRLWGKKIGLWYVHRNVNTKLRIAEKFSNIVFSTTPEAFRLKSKKVHFLGHGVDFSHFERKKDAEFHHPLRILHVGRITPIKNLDILVDTVAILKETYNTDILVTCVGEPVYESDKIYFEKLKKRIRDKHLSQFFSFVGPVSYQNIPSYYTEADISVNLTPTGGMDKAVLESIASGTAALSANRAFEKLFGPHASVLLYKERDPVELAKNIHALSLMSMEEASKITEYVYDQAQKNFGLPILIKSIKQLINAV